MFRMLARFAARNGWLGLANGIALATAFAAAILLASLVRYEMAFNAALDPSGTVYQIYTRITPPGRSPSVTAGSASDLSSALRAAQPGLIIARLLQSPERQKIVIDGHSTFESVFEADPEISNVFTFTALQGDVGLTLSQPGGAVLTAGMARKLFGRDTALGATFMLKGNAYRVGAVIEALPSNSSLASLEILLSARGAGTLLSEMDRPGPMLAFSIGAVRTFIRIDGAIDEIARAADRHTHAVIERMRQVAGTQNAPSAQVEHLIVGLRDLDGADRAGATPDSNRADAALLLSMAGLACLVVLVAVLNVVSLSTSQAVRRAMTAALQKVFGATRLRVAIAFLAESILTALLAAGAAVVLALLFGGAFSALVRRPLDLSLDAVVMVAILVMAVMTGLISGLYPATILSSFRPATILSARGSTAPGSNALRVVLVATQMAASVATITLAITVSRQLQYVTETGLGFQHENVVVYRLPKPVGSTDPLTPTLLNEMLATQGVSSVALAEALPTEGRTGSSRVSRPDGVEIEFTVASVTPDFAEALRIRLLAGRQFGSRDIRLDGDAHGGAVRPIIVSRGAARDLGYATPSAAIDAVVPFVGGPARNGQIVGVIEDIPLGRLRAETIPNVILSTDLHAARLLVVRLSVPAHAEVLKALDARYDRFFKSGPIDRVFLKDRVMSAYADVSRMLGLVIFFGSLSAAASCLGVLGMTTALSQRMRQEAGIRKAFGASALSIALLLLRRLAAPTGFGILVGGLIGWMASKEWLLSFSLRAEMGGLPELVAALIVAGLALMAAAWQVIRLAATRPAQTLGYE